MENSIHPNTVLESLGMLYENFVQLTIEGNEEAMKHLMLDIQNMMKFHKDNKIMLRELSYLTGRVAEWFERIQR